MVFSARVAVYGITTLPKDSLSASSQLACIALADENPALTSRSNLQLRILTAATTNRSNQPFLIDYGFLHLY